MEVVNLLEKFSKFQEHFTPKIAGEVNDFQVKLVKLKGEFVWHHHDSEDEMFLVVKGELRMKYRDAQNKEAEKIIKPGEFLIMHRGIEHMPYALEETHIVLFELGSTLNTGTTQNERTVNAPQWI
jgi:mannose-6-phosphate isomerase-like protein (cupin superfamily)